MNLPPLIAGRFLKRDNRFRVTVQLANEPLVDEPVANKPVANEPVAAHLPNSGRLTELLTPGRRCWLAQFDAPHRKTDFDLKLVEYDGVLVSVDARLPNPLFAEALAVGRLTPFRGFRQIEREVPFGKSRLDFRLNGPSGVCWVEVKSVTLVEQGTSRFPDAPTARGARHLEELIAIVEAGERAAVAFVVQRPDARRFTPHHRADPTFSATLREAADQGVAVHAWTCTVQRREIAIARPIPVDLNPERSI